MHLTRFVVGYQKHIVIVYEALRDKGYDIPQNFNYFKEDYDNFMKLEDKGEQEMFLYFVAKDGAYVRFGDFKCF